MTFSVGGFYKTSDDFKSYMLNCDTIFSITDSKIIPYIVFETSKYKLKTSEINEAKEKNIRIHELKKFRGIRNYSENENWAYFNFEIELRYHVFYNFLTKEIIVSRINLFDDIAYVFPNLYKISGKYMIGILRERSKEIVKSNMEIDEYKQNVDKKIRKEILSSLNLNKGNPIIVLYEFKE